MTIVCDNNIIVLHNTYVYDKFEFKSQCDSTINVRTTREYFLIKEYGSFMVRYRSIIVWKIIRQRTVQYLQIYQRNIIEISVGRDSKCHIEIQILFVFENDSQLHYTYIATSTGNTQPVHNNNKRHKSTKRKYGTVRIQLRRIFFYDLDLCDTYVRYGTQQLVYSKTIAILYNLRSIYQNYHRRF